VFDYSRINHVLYPSGTGGKFLINCLSLNDNAVLQCSELAQRQINSDFNVNDKINYIHDQLEIARQTGKWTDLFLGDVQLTGMDNKCYINSYPEFVKRKLNRSVLQDCISNKLHFFTVAHNFLLLEGQRKYWTNGKLIVFKNYHNFLNCRFHGAKIFQVLDQWNQCKGADWGDMPVSLSAYNSLPKIVYDELIDSYAFLNKELRIYLEDKEFLDDLWSIYLKDLGKTDNFFEFDVDYAYSNSDNFYKTYTKICNYLVLPAADQSTITQYFNMWEETINLLAEKNRNDRL